MTYPEHARMKHCEQAGQTCREAVLLSKRLGVICALTGLTPVRDGECPRDENRRTAAEIARLMSPRPAAVDSRPPRICRLGTVAFPATRPPLANTPEVPA